ncbi:hypothetical protein ACTBJ2_004515 [Vibrio parahaemolyticus]
MLIIETPYHYTFSDFSTLPDFCCVGACKKIWWKSDLKNKPFCCQQCSGELSECRENKDYKVIDFANRNLKLSDFKKFGSLPFKDKKSLQNLINNGASITNLGLVKPQFIAKAKAEWC